MKIIDFGAAQSTLKEEQTAPRVVIGNLTYMAPEQAKKQFVDRRADVYSAGVMLWELLAWHALPQKGDRIERWRRAAYPKWEPASRFRAGVPPAVDAMLMRALSLEPGERFPDAAALKAELARLKAKLAPGAGDAEVGRVMCEVFAEEKAAEDAVLAQLLGKGSVACAHPAGHAREAGAAHRAGLRAQRPGRARGRRARGRNLGSGR